jgi:hypothetical protein
MKLYADENVPSEVVTALRRQHDVAYANEMGRKGRRDVWHLRRAADEERVLLTLDFNDFRLLHRITTALRVVADMEVYHPGILTAARNVPSEDWVGAIQDLMGEEGSFEGRFLACHEEGRWVEDTWRAS